MRGLPNILSPFCNEFDKFKNTGAGMLDFIYHMTLKILRNHILGVEKVGICPIYVILLWTSIHSVTKICKPLVVYRL